MDVLNGHFYCGTDAPEMNKSNFNTGGGGTPPRYISDKLMHSIEDPELFILIVELLNSAIEAVVDRMGDEIHELSGRAKDMGSSAVFVAITMVVVIWVAVLYPQ